MDDISVATLTSREGQLFTVDNLPMRLHAIKRDEFAGGGAASAVFTAEAPHGLDQAMRVVGHPDLADTELFVVPSSPTDVVVTFTWLDQPQ